MCKFAQVWLNKVLFAHERSSDYNPTIKRTMHWFWIYFYFLLTKAKEGISTLNSPNKTNLKLLRLCKFTHVKRAWLIWINFKNKKCLLLIFIC